MNSKEFLKSSKEILEEGTLNKNTDLHDDKSLHLHSLDVVQKTMDHNGSQKKILDHNGSQKYECTYCNKIFNRNNNWNRHVQYNCKVKKQQEQEKNTNTMQAIQEMKEEIDQLKQHMNDGDINCNNTMNSHNTINNNTTNNINLVAFGQEDLSYISDKSITGMLSHGLDSVILLVREAHYNEKHPNHHNVYISNTRSGDIIIYNGRSWVTKDKKEIMEKLYNTKGGYLQSKFGILEDELDESVIKKFNHFIKKGDNPIIKKDKIKAIGRMMYNNREKPMQIKRNMKRDKQKAIK